MRSGINQSNSNVSGDQVGGDKITNNYNIEVTKELSPATDPIRTYGVTTDNDPQNTVLIRKLRDGEFNKLCPPSKNGHKKASKNGMNRNNSFVFIEVVAFIPRFT